MSKGEETRERIVDRAWRLASRDGLAGLSLQRLATDLGLSKSGLFAHFGSKQELELEVLKSASEHFVERVLRPALKAPRGVPRLRQIFKNWMSWANDPAVPGGCIFLALATELDDAAGPQRDYLVSTQTAFLAALAKAARLAIEEGHFRPNVDCDQFAFDLLGIVLAYHHARRLLRLPKAEARALHAFEALVQAAKP